MCREEGNDEVSLDVLAGLRSFHPIAYPAFCSEILVANLFSSRAEPSL